MLRRLGIRGKVLAALSVPVLVLFLLAGFVSQEAVTEAQTARTVATMLSALQQSREVATALQAERRTAAPFVTGVADEGSGDVLMSPKDAAREVTDDAIDKFERSIALVDLDVLAPEVSGSVEAFRSGTDSLPGIRGRVDAAVPIGSILNNYSRLIDDIIQFPSDVADSLDDRRLAAIIAAHTAVMDLSEAYHEEQVVGGVALNSAREPSDFEDVAVKFPASEITHAQTSEVIRALGIEGMTVPPLGASFVNILDGGDGTSFDGYRTLIATQDNANFNTLQEPRWTELASAEIAAFDDLKSDLRITASERAGQVATSALRTSILTIGAAVAAVLLSIITALAIARQIINPLRRLTEAAAMVRDELPRLVDQVSIPGQGPDLTLTRIPVTSKDEIGQLATAFNEVNTTTIQVAQEQAALRGSIAEMFVNVARRDQILLNRQLSFIDALERSEEDPKTLADLFRLDHLATRMRRNAESLLVLAGIDTGRRLRETLALSDVIRTASSEIEHYERVQLDLPVDPLMLGHTALPAAHMMAELLENATVFSEPGTPVQVSTGVDEESVIITITDQGLGMTPFELEEANTKIKATSAGDVLGSQRLGMFVVGRIAARLGASVELGLGPGGTGTIATIRMPQVLFVDSRSLPITAPSQSAPAAVETFVLPEEAAEVVHDQAFAPVPEHTQDVASGALGSEENPAEEVDLEALTDGTTGLGLPRRRASAADAAAPAPSLSLRDQDDAAAAPSIPLAPSADALAGAAATASTNQGWTPPVIQANPLTVRRPADADAPAAPGLPTRGAPAGFQEPGTSTGNLPTRSPSLPTRQPAAPVTSAPAASTSGPANPEGRSATFRGFRSRRAELAAAAVTVESGDTKHELDGQDALDGAERLAAAAGRSVAEPAPAPAPMVIPSLVDDDDAPYVAPAAEVAVEHAAPQQAQEWTEPVPAWTPPEPVAEVEQVWTAPEPVAEAELVHAETERVEEPAAEVEPSAAEAEAPALAEAVPAAEAPSRRRGRHALPSTEEEPPAGWIQVPVAPQAPVAEPAAESVDEPATESVDEPVAIGWEGQPAQQWQALEPVEAEVADQVPAAWAPESDDHSEQPWTEEQPAAWAAESDDHSEQPWTEEQPAAAWQQDGADHDGGQDGGTDTGATPWAEPLEDGAASWPPADGTHEPVSLDQLPPDPFMTGPYAPPQEPVTAPSFGGPSHDSAPVAGPAYTDLTQGGAPVAAPTKPAKRKFGLFGRKKAREPQPQVVETQPAAFTGMEPVLDYPTVSPVRQSAWSSTDTGAHALVPAEEVPQAPVFQPDAEPVSAAPSPFGAPVAEAPVFTPPAFEPTMQPTWQASEAPAVPAWQPPVQTAQQAALSAPAAGWQASAQAAVAAQDTAPEAWAPTPAWGEGVAPSLTGRTPSTPVVPGPGAAFSPQTTFTPHPLTGGAFDDEVTNMLAQRADLAQQALAELSQLSSYRPKAASAGEASTLVRRTPASVPAAPAIEVKPAGQRVERDANQVRSLISSFQSGTTRGRQASDPTAAQAATQNPGEDTLTGQQDGNDVVHGEPVTTPDTDTQRSTSW